MPSRFRSPRNNSACLALSVVFNRSRFGFVALAVFAALALLVQILLQNKSAQNCRDRVGQNGAVPYPVPECRVSFNPATGCYGFAFQFAGKPPHHRMDVFKSIGDLLAWVDSHKEMVWEEPSDADESCLMISRRYKPGSMLERCSLAGPLR